MIKIRKTKVSDYQEIYNLLRSEDMALDKLTKERFSRMLKKNKDYFFVALSDTEVIGNIFASEDGGYYGYVYKLIVRKDYRKKGVAQMLTKKVLDEFNKNDVLWIYAHVKKGNAASISLLKKFGFKIRESHLLLDNWD